MIRYSIKNGDAEPDPEGEWVPWERVEAEIDRMRRDYDKEINRLKEDCKFLLFFVPPWANYGTGSYNGDLELKARVDKIVAALCEKGGSNCL